MPLQPPWTDIGRLQGEISDIQRQVREKTDSHEVHNINSRLNSLESTITNIRSQISDLTYRIQQLEYDKNGN